MTDVEFISRLKGTRGENYEYPNLPKILHHDTILTVICHETDKFGNEHGEFKKSVNTLLAGSGCPKCNRNSGISYDVFVSEAELKHGAGRYDYSLGKEMYKNTHTKILIHCNKCNIDFWQTPHNHLQGQGCPNCAGKFKYNTDSFITKYRTLPTFNPNLDFSNFVYTRTHDKCEIICHKLDENGIEHGKFFMTPHNLLAGQTCPKCAIESRAEKRKLPFDEFINRLNNIFGNTITYISGYNGCHKLAKFSCNLCGKEFMTTPDLIFQRCGCPNCGKSQMELLLQDYLIDNSIEFESQKTFPWLIYNDNLSLDYYFPKQNAAIECQGLQHFEPVEFFGGEDRFIIQKERDLAKLNLCSNNGIIIYYYSNITKYDMFLDHKLYHDIEELINQIINIVNN